MKENDVLNGNTQNQIPYIDEIFDEDYDEEFAILNNNIYTNNIAYNNPGKISKNKKNYQE